MAVTQRVSIVASRLPPSPSGYPVLGNAIHFARDPFAFVEDAIDECGDIYRMELPGIDDVFVFAHPDYFNRVLVTDVDAFGKTEDYRRAFGSGLLSVEGQEWRRQREILQPLFYRDRLRGYTDQMVACTNQRLATWADGETRDMELEMRDLTLEILFATLFGRQMAPGEDQGLREAADGLNEWFAPSSWMLPPWVPTPARRRFKQSTKRLRREVRALLEDDNQENPPKTATGASDNPVGNQLHATDSAIPDLLTQLQRAREADDAEQLTTEEIEDQLVTMMFAGHETTAAALGFTWYLLATHPDTRDRFHAELDTVLDGDPPSAEDLDELEVTDRIIIESLRLYPPVHTIPRQTKTNVNVGGYTIPAGHELHLSIIHVHRDEQFYEEPLAFRPDRWTDEFEEDLPDFAYAPFGGGRRTCIGREFALLEAKVVLATIGQEYRFDWERTRDLDLSPRVTTQTKDGIPLRIHRR